MLTLEQQIAQTAQYYGVAPQLALELARRESSLNPSAIGEAGEVGLFQLMPATAAELGVNPWDVSQNIAGGIRYLRQMFDTFGDWGSALVAYNAGPGNVERGTAPASSYSYAQDILSRAGEVGLPVFSTTGWAWPFGDISILPAGFPQIENRTLLYAALAIAGVSLLWMMRRQR